MNLFLFVDGLSFRLNKLAMTGNVIELINDSLINKTFGNPLMKLMNEMRL